MIMFARVALKLMLDSTTDKDIDFAEKIYIYMVKLLKVLSNSLKQTLNLCPGLQSCTRTGTPWTWVRCPASTWASALGSTVTYLATIIVDMASLQVRTDSLLFVGRYLLNMFVVTIR